MAEIFLHGLHVVTVLQGERGEGVAQIMHTELKNKTRKHSFITLKDNRSAELECCRKILKFEDNIIELEIPCGIVRIIGIGLKFKTFGYDSVKISGKIHSVGFEQANHGEAEEL